jgi:hypothetical protein
MAIGSSIEKQILTITDNHYNKFLTFVNTNLHNFLTIMAYNVGRFEHRHKHSDGLSYTGEVVQRKGKQLWAITKVSH